jgi:hypothetical protein
MVTVGFAVNASTSAETYTVSIASGSPTITGGATVAITQAAFAPGTTPVNPGDTDGDDGTGGGEQQTIGETSVIAWTKQQQ